MIDQASELRKLVLQSAREQAAQAGPAPRMIVVTSGQGGVGVTSLAVNLSVALAEQGSRVVIVDADPRAEVAALCGLDRQGPGEEVLVARRDIHEVLRRGPAGIQIVPRLFAPDSQEAHSEPGQQRLLRQFRGLGRHAELLVLDAGDGTSGFVRRCCQAADDVVLVTTRDSIAVTETYVRIKTTLAPPGSTHLHLVVNRCGPEGPEGDVHRRLDRSCRRFLNRPISLLGAVPEDESVRQAAAAATPFVLSHPENPAARAVTKLVGELTRSPQTASGEADVA